MKRVEIDGVFLELAPPESTLPEWIGQDETLRQLLACWLEAVPGDPPLTPRLVGAPGLGKTTLAMAAAKSRGQRCWVQQCTADTRPEDLVVTPVLVDQGRIAYRASPLLTAVIEGGCCVLDEGNRMSEKSWASLASLLDHRRTIDSVIAGIRVAAAPSFRACVTMNDDGSTFELPEYILSRLQPAIELGYPAADEEERILAFHVPHAAEELRARCVRFLQEAHGLDLPFSIRDGIHSLRLALKRGVQEGRPAGDFLDEALRQVCGREAMDLKAMSLRRPPQTPTDRPGDFFFGSEDEDLDPDWDGRR